MTPDERLQATPYARLWAEELGGVVREYRPPIDPRGIPRRRTTRGTK